MRIAGFRGALLAAAVLAACGGDEEANEAVVPAVTRDAQLLYTVQAGTDWIGAVGRDAQVRAASPVARAFAATLAADHSGLHTAFVNAATSTDMEPVESGVGVDLVTDAQTARVGLQSMRGPEFDVAFVESAIRLQQLLLSAIERDVTVLQDPELRRLAEQTRPTLEAHIQRGQQLLPGLREARAGQATTTQAAAAPSTRAPVGERPTPPPPRDEQPSPPPRPTPVDTPPPARPDTSAALPSTR